MKMGRLAGLTLVLLMIAGCASKKGSGTLSADVREGEPLSSYSQEITSPVQRFEVEAGADYKLNIAAKNTGTQSWFGSAKSAWVDASYRWIDSAGNFLPIEGNRSSLSRNVLHPGESDQIVLKVTAPPVSGSYNLCVSMVQEGVVWFYLHGATPLTIPVTVN